MQSRRLVNFVAEIEQDAWTKESWTDRGEVADVRAAYEGLRLARTSRVQGLAEANKIRLHLPDGLAQQAHDATMAQGGTDFSMEAVSWLYGYDAGKPDAISVED